MQSDHLKSIRFSVFYSFRVCETTDVISGAAEVILTLVASLAAFFLIRKFLLALFLMFITFIFV